MSTGRRLLTADKLLKRQSSVMSSHVGRMMAGRRRVARMLLLVAVLFALSWLPYHAVRFEASSVVFVAT